MAKEYPDIVYRPGKMESVRGVMCDTLRVDDQMAFDKALSAGWSEFPPESESASKAAKPEKTT